MLGAMTPVTVVIPSYNHWELTHQVLFDVFQKLPKTTEIIVIDDCSTDAEVENGLSWWQDMSNGQVKAFRNRENLGFLKTVNKGVSKSSNDIVLVISNDVRVYDEDLAYKVIAALSLHPYVPTLVGAKLYTGSTGWNDFDGKIFQYLEGWFLAFRKKDWDKFGGFDEWYSPHIFEDIDISTTYIHNGGKIVAIDANMQHLCGQTIKYSPERDNLTKQNKEKFAKKWLNHE